MTHKRSGPSLNPEPGQVDLQLWPPIVPDDGAPADKTVGHYIGHAEPGRHARLTGHALGRGARLTQVQLEYRDFWVLAGVQPDTRVLAEPWVDHACQADQDITRSELYPTSASPLPFSVPEAEPG